MTTRHFIPPVQTAIRSVAIAVVVVAFGYLSVRLAEARHDVYALRLALCQARAEAVVARNPFVEKFARDADACLAMALIVREGK